MKISSNEENGLRVLIRIARSTCNKALTINELASQEKMSTANTAKILRVLRMEGYVESTKGKCGGYYLAKEPKEINIGKLLTALGGNLYDESFKDTFAGIGELCNNSVDCAVKSLFKIVQHSVDRVVNQMTLAELLSPEMEFRNSVKSKFMAVEK